MSEVVPSVATSWWHLAQATRCLQGGGVLAYPTEGVWGLGCDPWDPEAVADLLALKDRPWEKGVILVASAIEQVTPWVAPLSREQRHQLDSAWPGPVTFLLPDPQGLAPPWIRGTHDRVAIRVTAHPLVRALCDGFGGPIVSTSCNPAGRPPAKSLLRVRQYFGDQLDGILPGALGGATQPSRIVDLVSGQTLRA